MQDVGMGKKLAKVGGGVVGTGVDEGDGELSRRNKEGRYSRRTLSAARSGYNFRTMQKWERS